MLMPGKVSMSGPFNLGALAPDAGGRFEAGAVARHHQHLQHVERFVTGIGLGVLYRRNGRNIGIVFIAIYLLFMFAVSSSSGVHGRRVDFRWVNDS